MSKKADFGGTDDLNELFRMADAGAVSAKTLGLSLSMILKPLRRDTVGNKILLQTLLEFMAMKGVLDADELMQYHEQRQVEIAEELEAKDKEDMDKRIVRPN